ncbi:hypothetical protein [Halovivax gelatinilyticus]|uniref:hypothetical protein n=1 Tax=Halovivax gelatinilyticus TaxID=2961597 RepID=UPI0020CA330C|nr:hypothetical protein [Halovivax gelatinilyticus]
MPEMLVEVGTYDDPINMADVERIQTNITYSTDEHESNFQPILGVPKLYEESRLVGYGIERKQKGTTNQVFEVVSEEDATFTADLNRHERLSRIREKLHSENKNRVEGSSNDWIEQDSVHIVPATEGSRGSIEDRSSIHRTVNSDPIYKLESHLTFVPAQADDEKSSTGSISDMNISHSWDSNMDLHDWTPNQPVTGYKEITQTVGVSASESGIEFGVSESISQTIPPEEMVIHNPQGQGRRWEHDVDSSSTAAKSLQTLEPVSIASGHHGACSTIVECDYDARFSGLWTGSRYGSGVKFQTPGCGDPIH